MEPILRTENLTIRFGGHIAVDHVNFNMPEKHLKSIIGPNGAGKTTFFNLISGELMPSTGDVYFKGQSLAQKSAIERTRMGLGRSFQITNVFPNLTVLENVRLAVQSKEKVRYQLFRHYKSYKAITEKAEELLTLVLLDNKRDALATMLSHGEKRKLVKNQGDKTILLIEHKMDMILDLSDSIMVLFNGQLLADGTPQDIMKNETVQNAYLGGLYDEHLTEIK